jgi:RNA-directed DNA polymerase
MLRLFSVKPKQFVSESKEPKKTGGYRTITKPRFRYKSILSDLNTYLSQFPLNHFVYNRTGSSYINLIQDNQNAPYLLTADIDDFYPNVSPVAVNNALERRGFNTEMAKFITRLTTISFSLPQGFPTSATLAAMVLEPALVRLHGLSRNHRIDAGIYADNLVLSANFNLKQFENLLKKIFRQSGFKLNKFKVMGPNDNRDVMNILINNGMRIKRKYAREVRRDVFMFAKTKGVKKKKSIQGKMNFVRQINPEQAKTLKTYARKRLIASR